MGNHIVNMYYYMQWNFDLVKPAVLRETMNQSFTVHGQFQ